MNVNSINRRLIFTIILCIIGFSLYAQDHIDDSLKRVLLSEKEDTNKVNTLNGISNRLSTFIGNNDSSLIYANAALSLAKKIDFEKGVGNAFANIAACYNNQGNYNGSIKNYQDGQCAFQKIGNKKGIARCVNGIGLDYIGISDYPKALNYLFKSLALNQEMKDKRGIGISFNNIGNVYKWEKNHSKALEYYLKANSIFQEMDFKRGLSNSLMNIGNCYNAEGDYSKSLEYYLKALSIFQETGDKEGTAFIFGNIADNYSEQHDYTKAMEYGLKSLAINKETGDQPEYARGLSFIGAIYTIQKKYTDSKIYLDSALHVSKKTGEKEIITEVYQNLADLDSIKGDYKNGIEDYRNYILYRDSLTDEETIKKTIQAEMNYAFERKSDSTKAEQDKLNAITNATLKKDNLLNIVFISAAILLLIIGFLMFNRIKLKRKLEQQLAIAAERRRISIEMHDDLGSGLSKISLLSDLLKQGDKLENAESYLKNISESSKEMVDKMGNIVWALNTNYDKVENLVTYISSYAKEYFESTPIQCTVIQPENLLDIYIDGEARRNVFLTVKEALHNVLKHSGGASVIITISLSKNLLKICVQDNGKGIDLTRNSDSGNGLNNMKERMTAISGNFMILNHNGTTVELSFPISV